MRGRDRGLPLRQQDEARVPPVIKNDKEIGAFNL